MLCQGKTALGAQRFRTAYIEAWLVYLTPVVVVLCAAGQLHSQTLVAQPGSWRLVYSDDFEDGNMDDWVLTQNPVLTGSWSIVQEGTNSVLEGTNQAALGLAQRSFADFHLSFQLKLNDVGLLVGFRKDDFSCRSYWLGINSNSVNLNRDSDCAATPPLWSGPLTLAPGSWHAVDLVAVAGSIRFYLDGVLTLDASDPSPLPIGGLQFDVGGNGTVDIDNVRIYGPPQLSAADRLVWVKTGGPPGGIGYDVRMRMDEPSRMYATDAFTGVNISDDNGLTWYTSNSGITARAGVSGDAIPIFTLTVDPHNPDVIWVGTRNALGLYKSVDGGKTFSVKTNGIVEQDISFRGVTIDPNLETTVYAAAEIPSLEYAGQNIMGLRFTESKGVVYRSTDSGENWTAIWRGDALARYVWVDPRNSNTIFVSTGFFDVEAANADPQHLNEGGVGVLKSTDGGVTWRALNQANGITDLYLGSLAMNPQNPDNLLAGGSSDPGYGLNSGVFVTTDGGETWKNGVVAGCNCPTAGDFDAVTFAPGSPNIAYAAAPEVFLRSQDAGQTWTIMSGAFGPSGGYGPAGLLPGVPVALQVDPRNPDRVFLNNYTGGNFLTEDGGVTWQLASQGYTGATMTAVASDPADRLRVLSAGTAGLFSSSDAGNSWLGLNTLVSTAFTFTAIAFDPSQPGAVLAGDDSLGTIVRSTDGGVTRQIAFQQPGLYTSADYTNRHGFQSIVFAPSDPRIVYAGMRLQQEQIDSGVTMPSYGMLKSTDGGVTWAYTNDANMSGQNVNTIAVLPGDAATVYAGTIYGGVFISHDGGASWAASNAGLPSLYVQSLAIDPVGPSTIYAGLENGGVWKSTDAGGTWQFASAGLDPQASIRKMVIDPADTRVLYAIEPQTGAYYSNDGGDLWVAINLGLSTRAANALAITGDGGTLWIGTGGEGVFRLDVRFRPRPNRRAGICAPGSCDDRSR